MASKSTSSTKTNAPREEGVPKGGNEKVDSRGRETTIPTAEDIPAYPEGQDTPVPQPEQSAQKEVPWTMAPKAMHDPVPPGDTAAVGLSPVYEAFPGEDPNRGRHSNPEVAPGNPASEAESKKEPAKEGTDHPSTL